MYSKSPVSLSTKTAEKLHIMNPPYYPLLRGDRVGLIGDSITCDARWWGHLRTSLLTAHPGCHLEFINLAIPGDNAGEALERYDWDIAPAAITAAIVMLGMNDVWREGYESDSPTPEIQRKRKAAINAYCENLTLLVDRLLKDDVRIVVVSPSPYEQEADLPEKNLFGVDDALMQCTEAARSIAAERDLKFIDIHTPMKAISRQLRKTSPHATIIGPDRVHPEDEGHVTMAKLILEALDPQERVSSIATAGLSSVARNSDCKKQGQWVWEYVGSLPDPSPAVVALETPGLVPRRIVLRGSVGVGNWTIKVDYVSVYETNASQLADGVAIDTFESPLMTRARTIQEAGKQLDGEEKRMRNLLMLQIWAERNGFAREGESFSKYLDKLTAPEPPDHWLHISVNDAKELLHSLSEHRQRMEDLRLSLRKAAQSWRHRIELVNEQPSCN